MHAAPRNSSVLSASVLVLNRSYMAVRVISVRRAFVMLYREVAEVIHIENGNYANYDFSSWCDLSVFLAEEAGDDCWEHGRDREKWRDPKHCKKHDWSYRHKNRSGWRRN